MAKAKSKKNKRKLSERVAERRNVVKTTNPFELKINRQKHAILGRKLKSDKGLPGVSRSKAAAKRKETLLKEYMKLNKSNKFVDKRLGEYDATKTLDEKMVERFALERKEQHKKVNKFNLNDEEELTHYGQSLAEIEKYEDPKSDSDSDDNLLGADFVKNANFGGVFTKKDDDNEPSESTKSRKDYIEELIAKSKQTKYEKQQNREATLELTEKLDGEWKDVRGLLAALKDMNATKERDSQMEDYDLIVKELKFDKRGKPTNRLKTPEEIAKEEMEKLEKLEADRLRRMIKDDAEDEIKSKNSKSLHTKNHHISADDLDDGFVLANDDLKDKYCISYKDGKLLPPGDKPGATGACNDEDDGTSDLEIDTSGDEGTTGEDDESDEDDDEEEEEASDVASENDDSEFVKKSNSPSKSRILEEPLKNRTWKITCFKKHRELPYIFSVPETFDALLQLLQGHDSNDKLIIVERVIKCSHPCLAEGNKEKLEEFFSMLLQLVSNMIYEDDSDLKFVDGLVPFLYDLLRFSPKKLSKCMLDIIVEKIRTFNKECNCRGSNRTHFPRLSTGVLLKMTSLLFPTSDFWHPVVTPTMLFMSQILTQCFVNTCDDILKGLFICTLIFEYVSLSKRYVPEAINFLRGTYCSSLKSDFKLPSHCCIHPFKNTDCRLLEVQTDHSETGLKVKPLTLLLLLNGENRIHGELRLDILNVSFNLIYKFAVLYEALPSYHAIFKDFIEWKSYLPIEKYPLELKKSLDVFWRHFDEKCTATCHHLVQEKKVQPLKFLEPRIEENFDGRRHWKGNKDELAKQRLLHKYKREMKGAIREIRRDNQFLAKQQLEEQLERDNERKRKLKQLYHDLQIQEGDCKRLQRKKQHL